jgi:hypothetical protein
MMDSNKSGDREKARAFVRDILTNDFKQKADDALVDSVADKMLTTFPREAGNAEILPAQSPPHPAPATDSLDGDV